MAEVNRDISLYGTTQPLPESRLLHAGPVTAEFENGALRHISYAGIEVIRGIAFLARNVNWGTYDPEITGLEISEADGGFSVTYRARCADADQALAYTATISGRADGTLAFDVDMVAETEFATNRTGFVVLHPAAVAGQPLTVTHTDGSEDRTAFPELISPAQPVFDIRALAHIVCPGVTATCTMQGDAFEMEDQRNWTDASYKTYVRPLSKPWPYTLDAGSESRQSVSLTFAGTPAGAAATTTGDKVTVVVGEPTGSAMPNVGVALAADTTASATDLAAVAPQFLVCQVDMRHDGLAAIPTYAAIARDTGAPAMLELIVPDDAAPDAAASAAAAAVGQAGLALESVLIGPAAYLASYQPDAQWPDVPPLQDYAVAARAAFPDTPVGGGMFSYFTELNRKRPPAEVLDYVSHTTCPIVHDADDRAVMESLEALPPVIASVRAMAAGTAYRVGPSTIGMRQNPYGAAPADNPDNKRVAMAAVEPRHRGIFGAAWTLGYAAAMARGGVTHLSLAADLGPFGLFHSPGANTTPHFDGTDARIYPLYHVVRGLAAAAQRPLRDVSVDADNRIAALAFDGANGPELWLANLWPDPIEVAVEGATGSVSLLDADSFALATTEPAAFEQTATPMSQPTVRLDAYAVARISRS